MVRIDPYRSRPFALIAGVALLAAACTGGGGGGGSGASAASNRPGAVPRSTRLAVSAAPFALAAPVEREVTVWDGHRILIAGGLGSSGTSASGVFAFEPTTGKLTRLGSVPQAFHDAAGAMIDGKLFVFGGGTGESSDAVQTFDPGTAVGAIAARMPIALSDLGAASAGGAVYLAGGWDGTTPQPWIYATLDGTSFERAGRLPVGLRYPAVAAVGGLVVIAGGVAAAGPVSTVYVFDPSNGHVTLVGHLPRAIGHAAAFALRGKVYVAGGRSAAGTAMRAVSMVDAAAGSVRPAGALPRPLSDTGVATAGASAWLLGGSRGAPVADVQRARVVTVTPSAAPSTGQASGGPAPTASASTADLQQRPFAGLMVIADRGNNQILVMRSDKKVIWRYPSPSLPKPPGRFYFPDDAFWVHGGHAILMNEEENNTTIEIAYPSGKVIWQYGHQGVAGSARGYLHQPDDMYPLPGGGVVVADAKNCRILFFDAHGAPERQIGTNGVCKHGLPATVGYPNGDTPLANGDLLLSELHWGWIDEVRPDGTPVWQLKVPGIRVPSDPQQLSDGTFLAVDYESPGAVVRFTRTGHVLWSYRPTSGPGVLNHPSLAAPLPNGLVAVNDDYRHRVILIDPATDRIVWQYGRTDRAGNGPHLLSYPDGLDLLLPGGVIPLHVDFPSIRVVVGRP
jgi:outer membrane protein assembly factor BamB